MGSMLKRGIVAAAVAGAAVLGGAGVGQAAVLEQQVFNGTATENSPKEAKREAEKQARRQALIAGFANEQCVLLFADSSRLGPGYYWGSASIRCTR